MRHALPFLAALLIASPASLGAQQAADATDAAPTPQIAYQGRLIEAGLPVTGVRSFTFALLDASGAELWNSGIQSVSVNNGLYAVVLGGNGMPEIPRTLLAKANLRLRLVIGSVTLTPDTDLVPAFQARSAYEFSGVLAGDVGGTQNATTVLRLQGVPVDFATPPSAGQVLAFNGSAWVAASGAAGPVGPQGPQGPTGPTGATGPVGPAGPIGLTGPIGVAGPAGPQGPAGAAGLVWKGAFSLATTYQARDVVASEGAAYVAVAPTLTGITPPALGWELLAAKGDAGPAGSTGATGPQGPKGDTGAAGATGVAGPQGPKGDTGDAGAQGPKGDTGAAGTTGAPGPVGPMGATGPQGATGSAGPQGVAGVDGASVLSGAAAPTGSTGKNGDFYINTATMTFHGPKASGNWPAGVALEVNKFGTNTSWAAQGQESGVDKYIGEVWLTAGYLSGATPCDGRILSIQENTALFSLLGTLYGGNGTTTFALPDLRKAAPNGLTYVIATTGYYPSRY